MAASTTNATEVTLDRLQQQVEGGGCPISAACVRLESVVGGLCKDVITRPLLNVLGRILSLLLGDEQRMGWLESVSDNESTRALLNLLKPSGCIFQATLSHSALDDISHFELPVSSLPVLCNRMDRRLLTINPAFLSLQTPLQKQLQKQGVKGLPVPLDTCVYNVAREGTPRHLLRLSTDSASKLLGG